MNIGKVRGGSIKEIYDQKRNVYMIISLKNKWFTKDNMREYIKWGLKYTKEKFGVVVADTLQSINYESTDKYSKQAAIKKGLKEGDKYIEVIKELINELPKSERKKIQIIRWDNVKEDSYYKKNYHVFEKIFQNNSEFRNEIKEIVKSFITRSGKS